MAKLTRRGLLKQTSIGAATVGVVAAGLAAAPHLLPAATQAHAATADLSTSSLPGPMVAYVRDPANGEVRVLVGEREIIHRDPELVMRLLKAAQ